MTHMPVPRGPDGPGRRLPAHHRGVLPPLLALGCLAVVGAALRVHDPHPFGAWGWCPFLLLTGRPCPTCGGLRAIADLSAGQPAQAWEHHAYLTVSVPLVMLGALCWLWRWRRAGVPTQEQLAVTFCAWTAGLLGFGLLRMVSLSPWPGP